MPRNSRGIFPHTSPDAPWGIFLLGSVSLHSTLLHSKSYRCVFRHSGHFHASAPVAGITYFAIRIPTGPSCTVCHSTSKFYNTIGCSAALHVLSVTCHSLRQTSSPPAVCFFGQKSLDNNCEQTIFRPSSISAFQQNSVPAQPAI